MLIKVVSIAARACKGRVDACKGCQIAFEVQGRASLGHEMICRVHESDCKAVRQE
jgi:hypothetical protein